MSEDRSRRSKLQRLADLEDLSERSSNGDAHRLPCRFTASLDTQFESTERRKTLLWKYQEV